LADEVVSRFSSTLAPLSLSFSTRLQPIIDEREALFIAQKRVIAKQGTQMSRLRWEMQDMVERRKTLETHSHDLDRMLAVLVKLRSPIRSEEEDESEEGFPFPGF
jgi:hypothetical protein